jgi:hypothetical protein
MRGLRERLTAQAVCASGVVVTLSTIVAITGAGKKW